MEFWDGMREGEGSCLVFMLELGFCSKDSETGGVIPSIAFHGQYIECNCL